MRNCNLIECERADDAREIIILNPVELRNLPLVVRASIFSTLDDDEERERDTRALIRSYNDSRLDVFSWASTLIDQSDGRARAFDLPRGS